MFSKLLAGSMLAWSVGRALAVVSWTGVNIPGFEFGCGVNGICSMASVFPPKDGAAQMAHFSTQDNFNAYRLPVGWQYLVNNKLGGNLDAGNFDQYRGLVQACLATGSYCIIDIHNYARWNEQIIGQGGPSNSDFSSLWSQLAMAYAQEPKVVMGLMNEPHDVNIEAWAGTVQAAVTAIRKAGATSHYILMPGNDYTNAGQFATDSAPALSKVTNLDGSTTNLIYDVHKYLDSDNSGTHSNCVTDGIDAAFAPLANYLRKNKRIALLSEIGGGHDDPSCLTNVCKALSYLDNNSDVYLGYLGWAAGSFDPNYILSLTPKGSPQTGYTDQTLLSKCFANRSGKSPSPPSSPQPSPAAPGSPPAAPGSPPAASDSPAAAPGSPPASAHAAGFDKAPLDAASVFNQGVELKKVPLATPPASTQATGPRKALLATPPASTQIAKHGKAPLATPPASTQIAEHSKAPLYIPPTSTQAAGFRKALFTILPASSQTAGHGKAPVDIFTAFPQAAELRKSQPSTKSSVASGKHSTFNALSLGNTESVRPNPSPTDIHVPEYAPTPASVVAPTYVRTTFSTVVKPSTTTSSAEPEKPEEEQEECEADF